MADDFMYHYDHDRERHVYRGPRGTFEFTNGQLLDMSPPAYRHLLEHGYPLPVDVEKIMSTPPPAYSHDKIHPKNQSCPVDTTFAACKYHPCVMHTMKEPVTTTQPPKIRPPLDPGPNAPIHNGISDREWSYRYEVVFRSLERPDETTIRKHIDIITRALGFIWPPGKIKVTHGAVDDNQGSPEPGFTDADARKLVAQIATGSVRNAQLTCERFMRGPVT